MSPAYLLGVLRVELSALMARSSTRAALGVALFVGIAVALGMNQVQQQVGSAGGAQINNMPVQQMMDLTWRGVGDWALTLRNFFVLPMLLVLATASTLAGEIGNKTFRELAVRPISRGMIFGIKLVALSMFSALTLAATLVPALLAGAVLFGTEVTLDGLLLGYLASWASDIGLILLAALVSCFTRSVGGVVVFVIMALMLDAGARGLLTLLGTFGVENAADIAAILPGAALSVWEGWKDGWSGANFAGLGALWLICGGGALVRLQRMEIP